MRRFGSSTTSRDRAQALSQSLQNAADPSAQLAGLNQLCDMLNTGTEETLASLRPDQILPGVVQIMQASAMNPELTILATRALTYFVDAIQGSSTAVASCGGVDALCAFLLEIRDIELAEQALVCLDKIAQENPGVLLASRGPEAFLLFVDFFGIVIQRRAVSAVANLARRASPPNFHRFVPILQQLRNMILHEDDRMAENALTALSRIVQGVQSDNNKIQAVLEDAVPGFVEALETKHGALAAKILSEGALSPKIASTLVDSGIVTTVAKLLGGSLIRATPAPTPSTQTPQLGATTANNTNNHNNAESLSDLQLGASANAGGNDQQQQNQTQQQQDPQIRPEMALDLVTIVLRLLPEVHNKDFMVYLTEGCKFFDRPNSGNNGGADDGTATRRNNLASMLELPPGMPPELQETFRRMLQAAGQDGEDENHHDDDDDGDDTDDHDEDATIPNNNHALLGGDEDEEDGDSDSWVDEDDHEEEDSSSSSAMMRSRSSASASANNDTNSSNNNNNNLQALARTAGATISPETRWARCVPNRHECDTCEKSGLGYNDWFRSNERPDYDLCRTCFMAALRANGTTNFISRHGRTFSDMSHFQPKTTTKPKSKPSSPPRPASPLVRPEDSRIALLKDSPYILPRVAEGMHSIVKYRMGSEDTILHARVLDLIHRVVAHLTADEIRHFFGDIPLTTILTKTLSLDAGAPAAATPAASAVPAGGGGLGGLLGVLAGRTGAGAANDNNKSGSGADQIVGQHIVSLAICQLLLEKMQKVITPYFFRNGLSRALTVRSSTAEKEKESSSSNSNKLPIQQQLANGKSRRQFVATLAKKLNEEYFKDAQGSVAFDKFTEAAKLLIQYKFNKTGAKDQQDIWKNAVEQIVSRFGGNNNKSSKEDEEDEIPEISAHEMDDSGMLEGLTSWLQACVSSATADNNNRQETEIEGALQAVELVSSLFQISLENQTSGMSPLSSSCAAQPPTPPGSPAISPQKNNNNNNEDSALGTTSLSRQRNQQNTNTALHRFVNILQDIVSDCDKFDPASVRIRRTRDSVELKLTKEGPQGTSTATSNEMKVGIDRQANVGAIEDYLRGHVFGQQTRRQQQQQRGEGDNNGDNFEPVEEILPNLGKTSEDSATSTAAPTTTTTTTNNATSAATTPVYIRCGTHLLPAEISMLDVINKYHGGQEAFDRASKPLHFHFSIEPFPAEKLDSGASTAVSTKLNDDDDGSSSASPTNSGRQMYDEGTKNRIFVDFQKACTDKLHVDSARVSGTVARAMRLLRIIHVVTSNLNSLRCFLRMQNYHKQQQQENQQKSRLLSHAFFAAGPLDQEDAVPGIRFAPSDFHSRRLTAKCEKVLAQASALPALRESWCSALAIDCSFLLPLDTRLGILELGFLGQARGAVRHAQRTGAADNNSANRGAATPLGFLLNQSRGVPRVPRKKFRVWRDADKVMACAMEIFKRGPDGGTPAILEFEFYGDVGSGLGPTLEFYSLACEGFQKKTRGLFRSEDDLAEEEEQDTTDNSDDNNNNNNSTKLINEFCRSANGLYLAVTGSEDDARTLGSLLTRCLIDRRVASIYLSSALIRVLRGEKLVFDDISSVLPVSNWHSLMDIYSAGKYNNGIMIGDKDKNRPDCSVADLGLSFELPFQPTDHKPIDLKPNGANIDVDEKNCVEYAELVAKNLLAGDQIRKLAAELRNPLISILDSRSLRLFEPYELSNIWKGVDRQTSMNEFQQYTTFDHGLTSSHPTSKMLLEVLSEMNADDQRKFFRFLTGSPSLPVGGLASLRPKFTVVRRVGEDEQSGLPSAMTCQNYLKLPAYSEKEKLKAKVYQAMNEGAGSFMFT